MGIEYPITPDFTPSLKEPIFYDLKVKETLSSWLRDIEKYGFINNKLHDSEGEEDSDSELEDDPDLIGDPYSDIEEDDILEIEDGKTSLKGHCSVVLKNGDIISGRFQGTKVSRRVGKNGGFSSNTSRNLSCIWGGIYDSNGRLTSFGKAQLNDGTVLEGFFSEGYLHGLVRGLRTGSSSVVWIGRYSYGRPVGVCWKITEGGGMIVGRVCEKDGSFSGDNIAYLYPDLLTCIIGTFKNGVLLRGRATTVRGVSIDPSTRELSDIYFNPVKPDGPIYSYAPSDFKGIYCPFLLRDPLELSTAFLGPSKISEFAGEGLFAIRDITAGETVAFYNGLRIKVGEVPSVASDSYQVYIDWDLSKIPKSDYMDIPPGFECSKKYQASLGHKINHSFNPNCTWKTIEHPVFGRIPKLVAIINISAGEEFTCHYRIDMEQAHTIDYLEWYVKAWEEFTPQSMSADD